VLLSFITPRFRPCPEPSHCSPRTSVNSPSADPIRQRSKSSGQPHLGPRPPAWPAPSRWAPLLDPTVPVLYCINFCKSPAFLRRFSPVTAFLAVLKHFSHPHPAPPSESGPPRLNLTPSRSTVQYIAMDAVPWSRSILSLASPPCGGGFMPYPWSHVPRSCWALVAPVGCTLAQTSLALRTFFVCLGRRQCHRRTIRHDLSRPFECPSDAGSRH